MYYVHFIQLHILQRKCLQFDLKKKKKKKKQKKENHRISLSKSQWTNIGHASVKVLTGYNFMF